MRRPVLTLSTKQSETDHAPEGELTAEAFRDLNDSLSKAFQRLSGQSAFPIGSMPEMFRSPVGLIGGLWSSLEWLSPIAGFTEALLGPLPGFSPEFKKIAADCIGPDDELDLKKFKIKVQVRLGLSPNEPLNMSEREIVLWYQELDRRDQAQERNRRDQAQLLAELVAGYILAHACAGDGSVVLDSQSEELGARIRRWREKAGMTQYHLARLVKVDESTVKRWEGCKTTPTHKNTRRICKALKIPVDTLLNGESAAKRPLDATLDATLTNLES